MARQQGRAVISALRSLFSQLVTCKERAQVERITQQLREQRLIEDARDRTVLCKVLGRCSAWQQARELGGTCLPWGFGLGN